MTQSNSRISERSFSEGPVMMVCQRSEVLNQTNTHLWAGFIGQKGVLRDTLRLPMLLEPMKRCWREREE